MRISYLAACAIVMPCACKTTTQEQSTNESPASLVAPASAVTPKPRELSLTEKALVANTLPEALAGLVPYMIDTSDVSDPDPAIPALTTWLIQRGKWSEIMALPATKRALVMKDSDDARGARMCVQGTIAEIRADRALEKTTYLGGLVTSSYDVVRFVAVHSSGDLVEKSQARICGIVTGIQSYSNVSGGTTHAVRLVGMFDLPENKDTEPAPVK